MLPQSPEPSRPNYNQPPPPITQPLASSRRSDSQRDVKHVLNILVLQPTEILFQGLGVGSGRNVLVDGLPRPGPAPVAAPAAVSLVPGRPAPRVLQQISHETHNAAAASLRAVVHKVNLGVLV